MMPSRSQAEQLDIDGVAVRMSNPEKVYFPGLGANGGRKRDLVEYYRQVALQGAALHAVRDRPTFLQRFPEGIEGKEIYQKHAPAHHPDHVLTTRIVFPSGRQADAMRPTCAADIVWAANLGTVTFHPWPTTEPDNDHPDQLRIDMDPQPGTDFGDARRVACHLLRPALDELGLVGYPKTSGGRGVHVYIPIEQCWDFIQTRHAVIALARELERRDPDGVTTSWWKEERGERVFIDFNQNTRDRTMASPYSVRRTPTATVSTPVTWAELAEVHPLDCTMSTVPGLLSARGDPMEDMETRRGDLSPLVEWAERDSAAGLADMPYPPSYPKMPGEPKRVQPSRARDG